MGAWIDYDCRSGVVDRTPAGVLRMQFSCTCPTTGKTYKSAVLEPWTDESLDQLVTKIMTPLCPAPTPRECAVGETKCIGEDLYWCRDGIWTLQQYGAPQCIPTLPPPAPPACITEGKWAGLKGICCEGLEKDFWGFCRKIIPTPPPPPPPAPPPPPPPAPPPPPPSEACPRGAIYTRGLFEACDVGYYQGDIPGAGLIGRGMACICAEDYEPPLNDALEISALIPLALIIGAVLLVLTMVKR